MSEATGKGRPAKQGATREVPVDPHQEASISSVQKQERRSAALKIVADAKRRRLEPEPTAGEVASGSAAALHPPAEVSHLPENPDGATTETDFMQRKRLVKAMKQHIMMRNIKSICDECHDPGVALDAIERVLNSKSDSEDEVPSDELIVFPEEQVAKCPQQ